MISDFTSRYGGVASTSVLLVFSTYIPCHRAHWKGTDCSGDLADKTRFPLERLVIAFHAVFALRPNDQNGILLRGATDVVGALKNLKSDKICLLTLQTRDGKNTYSRDRTPTFKPMKLIRNANTPTVSGKCLDKSEKKDLTRYYFLPKAFVTVNEMITTEIICAHENDPFSDFLPFTGDDLLQVIAFGVNSAVIKCTSQPTRNSEDYYFKGQVTLNKYGYFHCGSQCGNLKDAADIIPSSRNCLFQCLRRVLGNKLCRGVNPCGDSGYAFRTAIIGIIKYAVNDRHYIGAPTQTLHSYTWHSVLRHWGAPLQISRKMMVTCGANAQESIVLVYK